MNSLKEKGAETAIQNLGSNITKNFKNLGNTLKNQTGHVSNIMDAHDQPNKQNPIEWHNFNYPPLIRLYHYQTTGIK